MCGFIMWGTPAATVASRIPIFFEHFIFVFMVLSVLLKKIHGFKAVLTRVGKKSTYLNLKHRKSMIFL